MWEGESIQEITSFKYLGFVFNNKSNYKDHILGYFRIYVTEEGWY